MNPNEHNELAVPLSDGSVQSQSDVSQPPATIGDEDFIGDPSFDPLAGAGAAKRFNSGIVLIVAVVLVAVAGLFSMRKLAEVTAAAGIDAEIESTIENFLKSITTPQQSDDPAAGDGKSDDPIMAVIKTTYSEHQVPLNDVQRDPFVIEGTDEAPVMTDPVVDPEELRRQLELERQAKRDRRKQELTDAAEQLALKTIMGGSRPMAIINGNIVHVGDTVSPRKSDIVFRVKSVLDASVELVTEDREFDLVVPVTIYLQR